MGEKKFPDLWQFLAGYFHEDFNLDYATPDAAILGFLRDAPPTLVRSVAAELAAAIPVADGARAPSEFLWRELGCYYRPEADGRTVAEWLRHVQELFAEDIAGLNPDVGPGGK